MERKPDGTDGILKIRKIPYRTIKKLGESYQINRNSKESYEKAIWQEETKSIKTEGWRQCVVRS